MTSSATKQSRIRHPEVAAKRPSKGDGPHPASFEARLWRAPQDDGLTSKRHRSRGAFLFAPEFCPHDPESGERFSDQIMRKATVSSPFGLLQEQAEGSGAPKGSPKPCSVPMTARQRTFDGAPACRRSTVRL
jgi:hypothetical protein